MPDALQALLDSPVQPRGSKDLPMPSAKDLMYRQKPQPPQQPYYQTMLQDLKYSPGLFPVRPQFIPNAADNKADENLKPPDIEYPPGMSDPRKDIRYWMNQKGVI